MQTAVTEAQLDASVGNVKIGFFRRCAAHLQVSVARPPPTAKNHVGFLDFRDLCQSFGVFKCSVVAVEEGSGDVDLSADCFSDQRFSGDSGLGAADDDSGFSIFAANIRNLVIGIAADGEVRKIRTIHK